VLSFPTDSVSGWSLQGSSPVRVYYVRRCHMPRLTEGFRSFVDGLRLKLLLDYWHAIREHAWELLWGAGPLGIAFVFYTVYRAPSLRFLGWVIAWSVFVAGYYAWRAYHLRLIPKLELGSFRTIYTPTNAPNLQRKFVQLLVKCATESPLDNCRGQLLRILKWSNGEWRPTHVDESLDLLWSNIDMPSIALEPGDDRQLDIFFVDSGTRNISPFAERMSMRLLLVSAPSDIFRFDVRVAAKDCPPKYVSVKVTFGQNWDDLALE